MLRAVWELSSKLGNESEVFALLWGRERVGGERSCSSEGLSLEGLSSRRDRRKSLRLTGSSGLVSGCIRGVHVCVLSSSVKLAGSWLHRLNYGLLRFNDWQGCSQTEVLIVGGNSFKNVSRSLTLACSRRSRRGSKENEIRASEKDL